MCQLHHGHGRGPQGMPHAKAGGRPRLSQLLQHLQHIPAGPLPPVVALRPHCASAISMTRKIKADEGQGRTRAWVGPPALLQFLPHGQKYLLIESIGVAKEDGARGRRGGQTAAGGGQCLGQVCQAIPRGSCCFVVMKVSEGSIMSGCLPASRRRAVANESGCSIMPALPPAPRPRAVAILTLHWVLLPFSHATLLPPPSCFSCTGEGKGCISQSSSESCVVSASGVGLVTTHPGGGERRSQRAHRLAVFSFAGQILLPLPLPNHHPHPPTPSIHTIDRCGSIKIVRGVVQGVLLASLHSNAENSSTISSCTWACRRPPFGRPSFAKFHALEPRRSTISPCSVHSPLWEAVAALAAWFKTA